MPSYVHQGCLTLIRDQHIIDAAVRLNPKLKLSPKFQFSAVHAVTRLDVSNNHLTELPRYSESVKIDALGSQCCAFAFEETNIKDWIDAYLLF